MKFLIAGLKHFSALPARDHSTITEAQKGGVGSQSNDGQSINKLGLSWGSTRLRQLAWSQPTKSEPQIRLDQTFFFKTFYRIKILLKMANKSKPDHL